MIERNVFEMKGFVLMIYRLLTFLVCVLAVCTGNVWSKASLNDFVCSYPESLKTALESSTGKSCQEIQPQDLSHLDSLQFVHTRGISEIDHSHFEHLPLLQALDFSSLKQLDHIPEFVYDLTFLKHLNISSTGIVDFNFRLCRLTELESFIGRNNTYKDNEIPFHTFCLENLRTLDMSYSGIIYIDEYLYYLQSLETLIMRGNALSLPPIVFPFLPSLKTVDFRGNAFLNQSLNTLKDCTQQSNPESAAECSADLKSDFNCEGYHRFIYNRGQPLRRYKTMTDQEFLELEMGGVQQKQSRCYQAWLIRQGGFDSFESTSGFDQEGRYKGRNSLNAHLLLRTINGKTVREWRLVLRLLKRDLTSGEGLPAFWRQPGDGFWAWEANGSAGYVVQLWRGMVNGCYTKRFLDNWIGVKDEHHTPDESEVFPEENIPPDFEEKKEWKCEY